MKQLFITEKFNYNGEQLSSLYSFLNHKLQGNSIVSWRGGCDIPKEKIVDGQDLLEGSKIFSEYMLHFIVEVFDIQLITMVSLQRLFCEIVKDQVFKISGGRINLVRNGDDLYQLVDSKKIVSKDFVPLKNTDFKFNISIATVSPVSSLMHFGINISSENTPVKTYSLDEIFEYCQFKASPEDRSDLRSAHRRNQYDHHVEDFAKQVMKAFSDEYTSLVTATQKVKWVK